MAAPVTSEVIAQTQSESALKRVLGVLAVNRYYRSYWIGNQASTLVMQMQMVANGYLAFVLTNSATALGVVAFAQSLPKLVVSPLGGVLADRLQKRALLMWMSGVQCLISIVIGVLVARSEEHTSELQSHSD